MRGVGQPAQANPEAQGFRSVGRQGIGEGLRLVAEGRPFQSRVCRCKEEVAILKAGPLQALQCKFAEGVLRGFPAERSLPPSAWFKALYSHDLEPYMVNTMLQDPHCARVSEFGIVQLFFALFFPERNRPRAAKPCSCVAALIPFSCFLHCFFRASFVYIQSLAWHLVHPVLSSMAACI